MYEDYRASYATTSTGKTRSSYTRLFNCFHHIHHSYHYLPLSTAAYHCLSPPTTVYRRLPPPTAYRRLPLSTAAYHSLLPPTAHCLSPPTTAYHFVTNIGRRCIEARILGGTFDGQLRLIPRIKLTSAEGELPYVVSRTQFPLRLYFAMTVISLRASHLTMSVSICVCRHLLMVSYT